MKSGRGGSREGSGRPAKYSTTDVVTIKVPRQMKSTIEAIARALDSGEVVRCLSRKESHDEEVITAFDRKGREVMKLSDLIKRMKVYKLRGQDVVRVDDYLNMVWSPNPEEWDERNH